MVHEIGLNSAGSDFVTPHAWVEARHGNLLSRIVLSVEAGEFGFEPGELVTGMTSTTTGTYVHHGNADNGILSLDTPSDLFQVGETLRGSTTGTEVVLRGYLAEGVIERGEMRAGSYFNQQSLVFHDEEGVTNKDHYMWLTAKPGEEHFGNADQGAVIDGSTLTGGQNNTIRVDLPFTRLEWFQVANTPGAKTSLQVQANGVFAQHMIFRNGSANGVIVSDLGGARSPEVWIANSLFYDFGRWALTASGANSTVHLANTTTYACAKIENDPTNDGCVGAKEGGELEVFNSAVSAALDGNDVGGDFYVQDGVGIFLGSSSNNASSDTSAPGAQAVELLLDSEFEFADRVSPKLRPSTESRLIGNGTPILSPWPFDISNDISGNPRTGSWNIGAY